MIGETDAIILLPDFESRHLHSFPRFFNETIEAVGLKKASLFRRRDKVKHSPLLNNENFWWMMGALNMLVAVAVIAIEVREDAAEQKAKRTRSKMQECKDEALGQGAAGNALMDQTRPERAMSNDLEKQQALAYLSIIQLVFCIVGLNVCMLLWGITQEYITTTEYSDVDGVKHKFPSTLFLVLCNRMGSIIFSCLISGLLGKTAYPSGGSCDLNPWMACVIASLPALTNLFASWSQYSSMNYVSFPLQTTAKSAKMLPVLLLGWCRGKRQTLLDYSEAIVITAAVIVAGMEDTKDTKMDIQFMGLLLLCGMTFFDSITPHLQDVLFQRHPDMFVIQANFCMSFLAAVICTLILLCNGNLFSSIAFLQTNREVRIHVLVLTVCSTLTQFLISYTIKRFGPIVFTLIVTTRQIVSVCISAVLFQHHLTLLTITASTIVFGTVAMRALWRLPAVQRSIKEEEDEDAEEYVLQSLSVVFPGSFHFMVNTPGAFRLGLCALAMHVPLCLWAIAQEFLATHTFRGQLFQNGLFLVAVNRTFGAIFALGVLKARGLEVWDPHLSLACFPAASNFLSTIFQYEALYFLSFRQQALCKTFKLIPVMIVGGIVGNRRYHPLEYVEGLMLTVVVAFVVYNFEHGVEFGGPFVGVCMMVTFLLIDSFTGNFQDAGFQRSDLDPAHMLLGQETLSCIVSWSLLILTGQLGPTLNFIWLHHNVLLHIGMLAFAACFGAYANIVTVRLYGPLICTSLMMSRQIVSVLISGALFGHEVELVGMICLAVVSMLILTSCLRKVTLGQAMSNMSLNALKSR